MPSGDTKDPLYVRFDAPNELWYDEAVVQLVYRGYTEVQKKGATVRPGRFSRGPGLTLHWKEPGQRRQTFAERLAEITANRL